MEWKLWAEQQVREQTVKANFRAGIRFAHVREMLELQRCFYNKQSRDKRRAKPLQLFLRNNKLGVFLCNYPANKRNTCMSAIFNDPAGMWTHTRLCLQVVHQHQAFLHAQRWNARDVLAFPLKDIHQDGNTCNYLFPSGLFFRACFKRGENIKYLKFHADKVNENIWDTLTAATEGFIHFIHIWNTTGGQDTLNVTS